MNKVIEIEGEFDEDDFQENISNENKFKENDKISEPNEIRDYSNINNLEEMIKEINSYYTKELSSALSFCENLSKDQIKSFDILEKFQSEFYSKEMIEIQETFGLTPYYLKKISEIKEKIKEVEKKFALIKQKKVTR